MPLGQQTLHPGNLLIRVRLRQYGLGKTRIRVSTDGM